MRPVHTCPHQILVVPCCAEQMAWCWGGVLRLWVPAGREGHPVPAVRPCSRYVVPLPVHCEHALPWRGRILTRVVLYSCYLCTHRHKFVLIRVVEQLLFVITGSDEHDELLCKWRLRMMDVPSCRLLRPVLHSKLPVWWCVSYWPALTGLCVSVYVCMCVVCACVCMCVFVCRCGCAGGAPCAQP